MDREQRRIAIYSRKSKYTGKGESVGNQIELCRSYIHLHAGEEAAKNAVIFEDEGFSGGNLDRPAFKKMMRAVKEHKISAIVVYRLDRISRNIGDFAALINELSSLDVSFISVNEQFDTQTPMGRAMMYIASVFSQLERETIAERIRDNMHELAKTGRWLGGTTPLGYCSEGVESVTIEGKKKKAYQLKLVAEEAEIVRTIFELFLRSKSLTFVEAELLKRRVTTKRGNEFTRFSIKGILQNPVYMIADEATYQYFADRVDTVFAGPEAFDGECGILAYNRTEQQKGRTTLYKPIEEWIITVGKHPGLIHSADWIEAQGVLEQNKSKSYRRPRNNQALLTGILYCTCGSRMYPKLTKRLMPDGEPIYSYVCRYKERSKGTLCRQRNVTGNLLDRTVVKEISHLEEDKSAFFRELERSKRYYTGSREQYGQQLVALQKELSENEKKIQTLVDSLTGLDSVRAKPHILSRMEELDKENAVIQMRIQEIEHLSSQQELSDMEFDLLAQLLSMFSSSMDTMALEQKRAAIRTLVRKIIWDGNNAHVILFGAEEGDIKYPPIGNSGENAEKEAEEPLEAFSDVDYSEMDADKPSLPLSGEDRK